PRNFGSYRAPLIMTPGGLGPMVGLLDRAALVSDDHGGTRSAAMPGGRNGRYDFFLSRRGSVAAVARDAADVLTETGSRVLAQDYDSQLGACSIEAMHEAVKNSRDLIILLTHDYEQSPYPRKEFTSVEAERVQSAEERHIIVLRCEDVPLR